MVMGKPLLCIVPFLAMLLWSIPMLVSASDPPSLSAIAKNILVNKKYQLLQKLGSGSFGSVFSGVDISTGTEVAVKIENLRTSDPRLAIEYRRYTALNGTAFVPRVYWYGPFATRYTALVMDRLGHNLDQLRRSYHKHVPLSTVIRFGERLVSAVEAMHSNSILHRDIKPSNMATPFASPPSQKSYANRQKYSGSNSTASSSSSRGLSSEEVYLIDFGSSRLFRKTSSAHQHHQPHQDQHHQQMQLRGGKGPVRGMQNEHQHHQLNELRQRPGEDEAEHIRYREEQWYVGTVKFSSLPALLEAECSRRDDLESLGLSLLQLLRPLPWENQAAVASMNTAEYDLHNIYHRVVTPIRVLCKGLPVEFEMFFRHVRSLGFYEVPNYTYLKGLFRSMRLQFAA